MSVTLVTERVRRAAHGRHVCGWCHKNIAARERYRDQRCAGDGTMWTWREHLACCDRINAGLRANGETWSDYEDSHPNDIWRSVLEHEDSHPNDRQVGVADPGSIEGDATRTPCLVPAELPGQLDIFGDER